MILELALSASLSLPAPQPTGLQLKIGDLADPAVTKAVLVTAATVLLISELIIVRERASGHIVPTISQILQRWGSQYNTVPYLGGALVTHWWLNSSTIHGEHEKGAVFIALSLVMLLWDIKVALLGAGTIEQGLRNPPALALATGAVAGALLWSQKVRF